MAFTAPGKAVQGFSGPGRAPTGAEKPPAGFRRPRCRPKNGILRKVPSLRDFLRDAGGESGIRTHDGLTPMPVFKTGALNRSAISPTSCDPVVTPQGGLRAPNARA